MSADPSTSGRWSDRRERVRLVAGIVVILAFIALATLAIAASRSSFSISSPAGASEQVPPAPLPDVPDLVSISTPLPMRAGAPLPLPPPPLDGEVAAPPAALPAAPEPPEPVATGKPCPQLGLPAPDKVGGIQSLVRLIPLFGPFSPEVFAMVPAFQPGIDVLGPLFPLFESGLDAAAPLLDVVVPAVQQLGESGFGVLAPLYGPVREDVLAGERALAAFLEPIVASLAEAPGTECFIALQALLVSLQPGDQ